MKKILHLTTDTILLVLSALCMLPFVYMMMMSLKSTINAYDFDFALSELTLKHYVTIFTNPTLLRFFLNSVFVSLSAVALTLVTSCLAGFAFARLRFKGSDKIFFLMLLSMMIPGGAILVPRYLVIRSLDWVNTFRALILPMPGMMGVFIMRNAILKVPSELVESAWLDGASNRKILVSVILPLVKSPILTVAIFNFIGAWSSFTWPLIVTTKDAYRTLPLALNSMQTQYDSDIGLTMACAAITFLPPFICYIFLQSKFEESMALSGMKT